MRAEPAAAGESFVITVRAKPRASVSVLEPAPAGDEADWVARLRASPVDGAANAELVALVARHYGCARSAVELVSGASARLKRLRVRPRSR